jgi:hypothetical protein
MRSTGIDVYKRIWIISGTVVEANTCTPLKGMSVVAFDVDHLLGGDNFGKAVTDEEGRYCIIFTWDNYKQLIPFKPDVYVKVYDKNKNPLKDTRDEVARTGSCRKTIDVQVTIYHEEEVSNLTVDDLLNPRHLHDLEEPLDIFVHAHKRGAFPTHL